MTEQCNECCENCDHVNRGVDETAHIYYEVSDRCPFYETLEIYRKAKCRPSIETVTQWTGCQSFVLDEAYKKQCEETELQIEALHKRLEAKRVKG
jgi:hypothetical protein